MNKFVKCISILAYEEQQDFLVEGQTYEIVAEGVSGYTWKLKGSRHFYFKSYFEEVGELQNTQTLSKECLCGIARVDCDYHNQA